MTTPDIDNINIAAFDPMPTPAELIARQPLSPAEEQVLLAVWACRPRRRGR